MSDYPPPPQNQPPGYPPPGGPPAYGRPPKNGMGTAALVLGILGFLAAITLIFFFFGIIFGIVAIVLGLIGRGRAKRGEATNKGAATAGLITGILALILGIAVPVIVATVFDDDINNFSDCIDDAGGEDATQQEQEDCAEDFADDLGGN